MSRDETHFALSVEIIWPLTTFYSIASALYRLTLLTALSGRYALEFGARGHCGPRALLFCIGVLPIVGYLGLARGCSAVLRSLGQSYPTSSV